MEEKTRQEDVEDHLLNSDTEEINLYNFEDEEFSASRYVLTSPRSLEACDMLGLKPAELLYKPLSDFQDEFLPQGLPLRTIYTKYEFNEKDRQRKLRECRDYRDKMIRDNMNRLLSGTSTPEGELDDPKDVGYQGNGFPSDDGYQSNEPIEYGYNRENSSKLYSRPKPLERPRPLERIEPTLPLKQGNWSAGPSDPGSLQRARTAYTIINHSSDILKSAVPDPQPSYNPTPHITDDIQRTFFRQSQYVSPDALYERENMPRSPRSNDPSPHSSLRTSYFCQGSSGKYEVDRSRYDDNYRNTHYYPRERSVERPVMRSSRSNVDLTSSGRSLEEMARDLRSALDHFQRPYRRRTASPYEDDKLVHTYHDRRQQSEVDELSRNLSRSLSLADLTGGRTPDVDGTHIRSRELRRSLGSAGSRARISHKDEKILEAMHAKRQREVEEEICRSQAQLEWEEERVRRQMEREADENRRRQLLAERIAEHERRQADLKARNRHNTEAWTHSLQTAAAINHDRWSRAAEEQEYRKELELREKRLRERERKLAQQMSLAAQEKEEAANARNHKTKSEFDLLRANLKKNEQQITEKIVKKRSNAHAETEHRRRCKSLERDYQNNKDDLKAAINYKEARNELNHERLSRAKDYTLRMNSRERDQKLSKSHQKQSQMEEEIKEWRESLNNRRKILEKKAELTAAQTVELKALRAHAERSEREKKQRKAYKKLQKEDEQNKRLQKGIISLKETKTKLVQQQKDKLVNKVRSLAATSQRMREELRSKYGRDSFDKKAKETELQNWVGTGHRSATKNKSRVLLA